MFKSWADGLAKSSTVRHVQLGMGVLVLSIAVLITARADPPASAHRPTDTGWQFIDPVAGQKQADSNLATAGPHLGSGDRGRV
jgi:hypothetical protein